MKPSIFLLQLLIVVTAASPISLPESMLFVSQPKDQKDFSF